MAQCRSCKIQVRWVETEAGKKMPIEVRSDPRGNLVLHADGAHVHVATQQDKDRGLPLYLSHFATCAQAATHRKKAR